MQCNTTKEYGKNIQKEERSAADQTQFKAGKQQLCWINNGNTNTPLKFKSHTDYITWKRMTAQLNSQP